jgi:glycosyltransferase involved in cell wall biosynthesis
MPGPLISTVIPTYNYAQFVTAAVESALAQTYPSLNHEVIVVDDGSTDDTRERLAPYMDRIRYIYQENQGLSAARNTGIREARGDWIALLDSDDVWHSRKLEIQTAYLADHPQVELLGARAVEASGSPWPAIDPTDPVGVRVTYEDVVVKSRFSPSSVLVHRRCFEKVGLFDQTLRSVEDRDMWIRIARACYVAALRTPLLWYRVHSGSMSHAAGRMEKCELQVLQKVFPRGQVLTGPIRLRLKAYSYAAFSAAYVYDVSGQRLKAVDRIIRSLLLWPFPYRRDEVRTSLARLKVVARIGLHSLAMERMPSVRQVVSLFHVA